MASVYGVNEILTVQDLIIINTDNGINSVKNLINKIDKSINSPLSNYDNIINNFNSKTPILLSSDKIITDLIYDIDLLKFIPISIKVNIVNNEAFLFINDNVSVITIDEYNTILNDSKSYITNVNLLKNNVVDNDESHSINEEFYFLHTRLYNLYNLNINIYDILSNGLDYNDLVYITTDVPSRYLDLYLTMFNNIDCYVVNKVYKTDTWVNNNFFNRLFTIDMTIIKNNRVREFVWYVRKVCEGKNFDLDIDVKFTYDVIKRKISSTWSKLSNAEVLEDFPELSELYNYDNIVINKIMIIGNKNNIVIKNNTGLLLLDNKLNKLKLDLSNM